MRLLVGFRVSASAGSRKLWVCSIFCLKKEVSESLLFKYKKEYITGNLYMLRACRVTIRDPWRKIWLGNLPHPCLGAVLPQCTQFCSTMDILMNSGIVCFSVTISILSSDLHLSCTYCKLPWNFVLLHTVRHPRIWSDKERKCGMFDCNIHLFWNTFNHFVKKYISYCFKKHPIKFCFRRFELKFYSSFYNIYEYILTCLPVNESTNYCT